MAPARIEEPEVLWNSPAYQHETYEGPPRNVATIDALNFPANLQPKAYDIEGTDPDSKILFLDVDILDASEKLPYRGDVLIEGKRFTAVGKVVNKAELQKDPTVRVIEGNGRMLIPGLGDAHTHFSWNNGGLTRLGDLGVEEHVILSARNAQCFLDSGYTMCFGAASAKDRLDIVVRDAINAGDIPGPRYLANGKEIARSEGELVAGITAYADDPEQMRAVVNHHADLGVDQIKLSMSGEEMTETRSAKDCYFTEEESAACAEEAHGRGIRLCSHARARDSVTMCIRHGVDIIYHGSYIDEEGMDMLEAAKTRHVVAPALNWLYATLHDAAVFGYTYEKAEQVGYKKELEIAIRGLREMHRRGIVVLPGGDHGLAWTPHGTYARDLAHFKNLLGFTSHEAIIAATRGVAAQFMRGHELGQIKEGYLADCVLVDGDVLAEIEILQDHDKLNVIVINGRVHKEGKKRYVQLRINGDEV